MYWLLPSVIRAPRVPLQQNALLWSLTLPPETPKCWFLFWWLLPPSAKPGVSNELNSRSVATRATTIMVFSLSMRGSPLLKYGCRDTRDFQERYLVVLKNKAPDWRTGTHSYAENLCMSTF